MTDPRVHVTFDHEHDLDLHERLCAEAGRTGFDVLSGSERGEPSEAWLARVRARIAKCDEVIVICGEHTEASDGVSLELAIARDQEKPYVLLWGRRETMCTKPKAARNDDGIYSWTPEVIARQLAQEMRKSRAPEIPASLKSQGAARG